MTTYCARLAACYQLRSDEKELLLKFEAWLKTLNNDEAKVIGDMPFFRSGNRIAEMSRAETMALLIQTAIVMEGGQRGIRPAFG